MTTDQAQRGKMIVFTAPSGAGKTTIVRHLLKTYPEQLGFSTSATTRAPRPNEVDGKDYYFMSVEAFMKKKDNDEFAEYEEVYEDQYYGTLNTEIERLWREGRVAIFDIDVKGAVSLQEKYPEQCLTVFVRPPSIQTLIDRLRNRKTETEASFKKRIRRAKEELSYENRFKRVLVNDLLEVALKEAETILEEYMKSGSE